MATGKIRKNEYLIKFLKLFHALLHRINSLPYHSISNRIKGQKINIIFNCISEHCRYANIWGNINLDYRVELRIEIIDNSCTVIIYI